LPLPLRLVRDRVGDEDQVTVCDQDLFTELHELLERQQTTSQLELSDDDCSALLVHAGAEERLKESQERRVMLPGGGSIVIDHTEALTAIDVNSGSAVSAPSLETTVVQTNQAAAIAAARQIRLRNISGIIIIDFIEMTDASNRENLMHILSQMLDRDPARIHLLPLDEFGLAKLTRKQQ
jgi:ribonuclease G